MGIQATEYNSLYFNQIRVLCTGSMQREICWANVSSDRPQQPRWLVVAQVIVLFVPLLIVDLLQMLWIQFDEWKRGSPLAPPLSSGLRARLLALSENPPALELSPAVIERVAAKIKNTGCLQQQIRGDNAAIVFSYLEDRELGGIFQISARICNAIQNVKDDTWLHNLVCKGGSGGYIHDKNFCKISTLSKRNDFAEYVSKLSRKISCLHVNDQRKLDSKGLADGLVHFNRIRTLALSLYGDQHEDVLARALHILGSQLECLHYSSQTLPLKIAEAIKSHCPNVKEFSFNLLPSQSIVSLIPHLKKVERLNIQLYDQPVQRELLEAIENHLPSLSELLLGFRSNTDFPIAEWEKFLTNNQSLRRLLLDAPFSPAILDAIHTFGSNLQQFSLWLRPQKGNSLFSYFQEAPMSNRLLHLTGLTFYFSQEHAISFAVFQPMITSLMNRYPKLDTLHLFDLSVVELDKVPALLRRELRVVCVSLGSGEIIDITSAGVTRR